MRNINLFNARKQANLTQEQIAKQVGCSWLSYQYYETHRQTPKVDVAIRIADAVGVDDYAQFKLLFLPAGGIVQD